MTIRIKRTGGYAGLAEPLVTIDTAHLPAELAGELHARIDRLTALAAHASSPGADLFQYEIEVAEPGATVRKLTVIDEGNAADPAMQQVMAILASAGN